MSALALVPLPTSVLETDEAAIATDDAANAAIVTANATTTKVVLKLPIFLTVPLHAMLPPRPPWPLFAPSDCANPAESSTATGGVLPCLVGLELPVMLSQLLDNC
jgi:hypothetical protein